MKTAAILVASGALVAADISLSQLSKGCQDAISGVQANAAANDCLAASGLFNILITPKGTSVIAPVNNWLTSFCGAADCSPDTISAVVTNVTTGCAADLNTAGVQPERIAQLLPQIESGFGTVKSLLCLADKPANEFCVTEVATNLEKSLGKPISIDQIVSEVEGVVKDIPKNVTCVPCVQAAVVTFKNSNLGSLVDISSEVSAVCGADFAAVTAIPAGIIVGTGANVPKGDAKKGGNAATFVAASVASVLAGVAMVLFA